MSFLNNYFEKGIKRDEQINDMSEEEFSKPVAFALEKRPRKYDGVASDIADFDPNHYRIFVGNLGEDVTDIMMVDFFQIYDSFQKARVVRDKNGRSKGFGFATFKEGKDFLKVLKEKNNKFLGKRPVKIKKSNWKAKK
eukprot:NODE_227_length_12294_cov_1.542681.p10 type:complete len:138 gc:universal NODE_227_length_12294_cov_1.542681:1941-2354(+)